MVDAVDLDSEALLRFAGAFIGARAGDAWVAGAQAEKRYDEDEPYVRLVLSLGPPPAGRETWTTDDMFELRQEVRRRIADSGLRRVSVSYVGGAAEGEDEASAAVSPERGPGGSR
jgi:hypothetical protein